LHISKNVAYGLMVLAALAWSTSGILTVLAIEEGATANIIALYSEIVSGLLFVFVVLTFDRPSLRMRRADLLPFFIFSTITGAFFSLAWYNCIDLTSVTTAVILLCTYPCIVTVASIFMHGERLTLGKAIALPLTIGGCVLVSGAYDPEEIKMNAVGIGLGIFAAFGSAAYYLWGKKFLKRYSANTVALYFSVMMIPTLIIITDPRESLLPSLSASAWALVFLLGLIPCTIGFFLSMVALKRIEASKASIMASLEPVMAIALAVIVIAEIVEGLQYVGVVLTVAGVVILRIVRHKGEDAPIEELART